MKFCSKCNVLFVGDHAWCKECRKDYDAEYHKNNKVRILEQKKAWREEQRRAFEQFKSTLRCIECGEDAPECLDFHHLDSSTKDGNIADIAKRRSFTRLKEELDKCVVLCSNCHRKVHSGRIVLNGL